MPLPTNPIIPRPISQLGEPIKPEIPFEPLRLNEITITNSMFGLLRLFSRVRRCMHGLVTATYQVDTEKYLIDWIEPVKPSHIIEAIPDGTDFLTRKNKLEQKGRKVIGEFRTADTMNLTERDRQRMRYHFLINQHHIQLIASNRTVTAFAYDGMEYSKTCLKPIPIIVTQM